MEYYKVLVWCNKFFKLIISYLGNEIIVNIIGLMFGIYCSVIIIGFVGGFLSILFNYIDIEIIE